MDSKAYYIAQLITKYLQGPLSAEEQRELDLWLAASEDNRATLEGFRNDQAIERDTAYLRRIDLDKAWRRLTDTRRSDRMRSMYRWMGAAAAAVLVVSMTFAWFFQHTATDDQIIPDVTKRYKNDVLPGGNKALLLLSTGETLDLAGGQVDVSEKDGTTILNMDGEIKYETDRIASPTELIFNTLVVPKAGTYRITLSDGTKVWLNALSKLRFPVQFGASQRVVQLERGEAYFEVAHDPGRPFTVEGSAHKIEVLGTHFNVNSYSPTTIATLIEGAVKVSNGNDEELLKAGQGIAIGEKMRFVKTDAEKTLAWKNGEFIFKSDPVATIMNQVARWYDLEVIYKGQVPQGGGYTGSIGRNNRLSEVLEMLGVAIGASFAIDGKQLTMTFN